MNLWAIILRPLLTWFSRLICETATRQTCFSGLLSPTDCALQYLYGKKGSSNFWATPTVGRKKKTFFFFMVERTVNWMIHHCDNDIEWWWSILIVFDNHHHLVTTCFHVNAFPYRIRGRTFSGITTAEAAKANRLMFCKMTNESTCL